MTERIDQMRAFIASATLAEAQPIMYRQIRSAARRNVYAYATEHSITDFADTVLVTDRHRTYRQNVISAAQAYATDVQAAANIAEVLVVFDLIAPWLE